MVALVIGRTVHTDMGDNLKIYLASSWRNEDQPGMVAWLRNEGHEVYDFRNPGAGNTGFHWTEIDGDWQQWDSQQLIDGLNNDIANQGFAFDMRALEWCDTCIMMRPCGVSAALELGWAAGSGRRTACYLPPLSGGEPELMLKIADFITNDLDDLRRWLNDADSHAMNGNMPTVKRSSAT